MFKCLFKSLSKKTTNRITGPLCVEIHNWPVDSHDKVPVTRRAFPCNEFPVMIYPSRHPRVRQWSMPEQRHLQWDDERLQLYLRPWMDRGTLWDGYVQVMKRKYSRMTEFSLPSSPELPVLTVKHILSRWRYFDLGENIFHRVDDMLT